MLTTENNSKIKLLTLKIKTSKWVYTPPKYIFNQNKAVNLCYTDTVPFIWNVQILKLQLKEN